MAPDSHSPLLCVFIESLPIQSPVGFVCMRGVMAWWGGEGRVMWWWWEWGDRGRGLLSRILSLFVLLVSEWEMAKELGLVAGWRWWCA